MLWKQAGFEWRPALAVFVAVRVLCQHWSHSRHTNITCQPEWERCFVRAIVTTKWRVGPQSSLQANIQSKSESGPGFCHQAWRIEIITNLDRRNIEHLKAQLNSVILFLSPISFLASSTLPVVTESGSYSGWLYEKHYYSLWILISSHLDTERREGRELLE